MKNFERSLPGTGVRLLSQSTRQLAQLQQRVPVVGDKALIDLVNGIQVNRDVIRYRHRGLLNQMDRGDRDRQILLDGNLLAGQEALQQWVLELSDSLRISQVALEVTQQSLLEARHAIRTHQQRFQGHQEAIAALTQHLGQIAQQVAQKLNQLEERVRTLEVRMAAHEDFSRIMTAWTAAQTYSDLPWAVQVALLAREVFSSTVALYERETGNFQFRSLLVNKILANSAQLPQSFFGLAELLEFTWTAMSSADRSLAATLLEVRSVPQQRLFSTPILFTLGTTLELANLPEGSRPGKPAHSAIALCRAQIDSIFRTTDARELVTAIVEETADQCLSWVGQ